MNFAAQFAPVGRIFPSPGPAQGGRHAFAVQTLPVPGNPPFPGIEAGHSPHDLSPAAILLPGLKAFMQHTTRNPKPVAVDRFPLATGPQDVPEPIHHVAMRHGGSARSLAGFFFGQFPFDNPPQLAWHLKVVHILRFCVTMFFQGISFQVRFGVTLVPGYALFFNSQIFFG